MRLSRTTLLASLLAATPAWAQDRPAMSERSASTSLYSAWLIDQLHADPARARAAYRAVVDDGTLPREERLVALARLLSLAAMDEDKAAADAARGHVAGLLGNAASEAADNSSRRLAEMGAALRSELRRSAAVPNLDALAAAYERTRANPAFAQGQRTSAWGATETLPEVQRRMLRAAEERGDTAEAGRLRRLMAAGPADDDGRSTRARQIQRWARDAIESELDGQRDKAARLRANLMLLRIPGRGPATIAERFQRAPERMIHLTLERLATLVDPAREGEPLSERERSAARRALAEARRRHAAGDVEGALALLWPAAVLFRAPE